MPIRWYYLPTLFPEDGEIVWVRRYGSPQPFLATWSESAGEFSFGDYPPIPWYFIVRWRPQ